MQISTMKQFSSHYVTNLRVIRQIIQNAGDVQSTQLSTIFTRQMLELKCHNLIMLVNVRTFRHDKLLAG